MATNVNSRTMEQQEIQPIRLWILQSPGEEENVHDSLNMQGTSQIS